MATETVGLLEDGVMTVPEGQQFSRLSRSALYALMERGELAYVKLGKRRMIPRRALMEMMERGLVVRQPEMVCA
jgi:excisionase family DNA binding protein